MTASPDTTDQAATPDIPAGFLAHEPTVTNFVSFIGPLYYKAEDTGCRILSEIAPHHLDRNSDCDEGLLLGLADTLLGRTAATIVGSGKAVTITLNCQRLATIGLGARIEGIGRLTRRTPSVMFLAGELRSGDTPLLTATGIWRILGGGSAVSKAERPPSGIDAPGDILGSDAEAPPGYRPLDTARDPFARHIGPIFAKHGDNAVWYAMRVEPRHGNLRSNAHGAFLVSFANAALARCADEAVAPKITTTLSVQSDFLRPVRIGDVIECCAVVAHKTRSVVFVEAKVVVDGTPVLALRSVRGITGAD